ncbi:DUF5658 family protein [bacterium]
MIKKWFEKLRRVNQKQMDTIRQNDGLFSNLKTKYVRGMLIIFLLSTLLLCITDGLMTVKLLNLGAWEANPIMRYALSQGIGFFIFSKYFLTAGGLLVLLRFGKVRIFNEHITLEEIAAGFLLFYQGLVLYELECYIILT